MLPYTHDEPVHLVINLRQSSAFRCTHSRWKMRGDGKARFQTLLRILSRMSARLCNERERFFKQLPNFFIRRFFWKNLVASENPSRVGVDHENWMVPRIEQDGI